jgi:hypothetical protein
MGKSLVWEIERLKMSKINRISMLFMICSAVLLAGCGPQGLQSLEGQLVFQDGGSFEFSGDTIELRSQADSKQLAFGEIKPDGQFKVDSLVNGAIVQGTTPGVYFARILISDDDYEHKKLASKSINKKYLSFKTSGLSVTAPSTGVTLQISK